MRLENWSIRAITIGPYEAPELAKVILIGNIYDDIRNIFHDGMLVHTSRLLFFDGKTASTSSGSVYELGKIEDGFVEFLKNNNYTTEQYYHDFR